MSLGTPDEGTAAHSAPAHAPSEEGTAPALPPIASGLVELALARPWATLLAAIVFVALFGAGLAGVRKDPSVDAFVPHDHPAAIARDTARDVFGLEDPVVIGLAAPEGESAFTPARLDALRTLDDAVRRIDGVKKNDVVSLASENAIGGTGGDLAVDPVIPDGALDADAARLALERFRSMPMMAGLLGSASGDLVTLIVPVEDPNHAVETVAEIRALAGEVAGEAFTVHVAGVATMNARLADMVDSDTRIFVPAAVLTVLAILLVALRRPAAVTGPVFVIAASAAIAIGLMGWLGARYYLITTALPIVIMAIAVADSLHISTFYLKAREEDPDLSARAAARRALGHTFTPITLTTITTMAAFVGLSFGAAMKPISEFGLFAAVGVAAAWLLSLTALPAVLVLTDLKPRRNAKGQTRAHASDRFLAGLSRAAFARPAAALALVAVLVGAMTLLGLRAEFDYERQRYFTAADQVRLDDAAISDRLGGVNFLDVVVSAPEGETLMTPEALAAIAELRRALIRLPHVAKASGIDEYISLMHTVLTDAPEGALPTRARAPAQYMFLYEASGAPEDFKQEIDYDHRQALVRAQLSTDRFSTTKPVVDDLDAWLTDWRARSGLEAAVSGRVAVNDGWMSTLSRNHFIGLGAAAALVAMTALLVFRSVSFAALAMLPVIVGVLSVYAAMGLFAIDIAPATAMTSAIATGLGVDFGIHLVSQMRRNLRAGRSPSAAFEGDYVVVARACLYSALALGTALAVVCISSAPPLRWFGILVSLGVVGSLLGALLMVPAISAGAHALNRRRPAHA